jgi:hypothetical protein
MTTTTERRLAELEAAARRLLPKSDPPFEKGGWLAFLTCSELDRLETLMRQQAEAGLAVADVPEDLYRRALGRAVMGADMEALYRAERDSTRTVHIPHPGGTAIADYIEDQTVRGSWHIAPGYAQTYQDLPRTMSQAEIEAVTRPPRSRS